MLITPSSNCQDQLKLGSGRCRSLIAGKNASSLSNMSHHPAGSVVLSAVGTGPPHVGVQNVGAAM